MRASSGQAGEFCDPVCALAQPRQAHTQFEQFVLTNAQASEWDKGDVGHGRMAIWIDLLMWI
jgi:hypothetical protein